MISLICFRKVVSGFVLRSQTPPTVVYFVQHEYKGQFIVVTVASPSRTYKVEHRRTLCGPTRDGDATTMNRYILKFMLARWRRDSDDYKLTLNFC